MINLLDYLSDFSQSMTIRIFRTLGLCPDMSMFHIHLNHSISTLVSVRT